MKQRWMRHWRYTALAVVLAVVSLVYVARLVNLQITARDSFAPIAEKTYSRTVPIQAHRGEIFDRNGLPLVTNVMHYDFVLDYAAMPAGYAASNEAILAALDAIEAVGEGEKKTSMVTPFVGQYPDIRFDERYLADAAFMNRHARILKDNGWKAELSPEEQLEKFGRKYKLIDKSGELLYEPEVATLLLAVRYDMEYDRFSRLEPYVLAKDVSLQLITCVKERQIDGAAFREGVTRQFVYPGYASHILGRVGKIQSEEKMEYYTALGYPMDAVVGISGCEEAFEEYLHGEDGELTIIENEDGEIVDCYVSREPVAGQNVWLTIDIGMQIAAEDALAENVAFIREKAAATPGTQDGEDASAGALTAIGVNTGEVWAMASYPTYDLSTFSADFAALNQNKDRPMVNRALSGLYTPGSTFKIGVAAAALTEGIITPYTTIETKGIYTYYAPSYTPRCWYYLRYWGTHGTINVKKALQVSCNYFFYDVGRQLGIDNITRYMRSYGLGEKTGIELYEESGVLAGPEYREQNGLDAWMPGDTIQAAIGQSDNQLTPMQLSVYLSTITNGGTRYGAHLLHSVHTFNNAEVVYTRLPNVASKAPLSAANHQTLMEALKSVTEDDGSAARIFRDYPIEVGGKTGTAQVSKTMSDNAVFTAFAPWDSPELAVSCIIEQGNNGTDAGNSVREVFDYYFRLGDYVGGGTHVG